MRHRRKGRVLGRSPSHQRALLRNLATAIFLTERNAENDENAPKIKGRIVTTLQKAKEVRPVVERCVTIAIHSMKHTEAAQPYAPPTEADGSIDRTSEFYREWKTGPRSTES
jgi:large subunit ribosomal protein L17